MNCVEDLFTGELPCPYTPPVRALIRTLLTWLLLAALPLQGWAMAERACNGAMSPADFMVRAVHEHAQAGAAAMHPFAEHVLTASRHAASGHHLAGFHGDAAPAAAGHDHGAHDHGAAPAPIAAGDHSSDATSPSHASCSQCAACCVGAVLVSRVDTPRLSPPRLPPMQFASTVTPSFVTDGPERPPRTI